MGQASHDEHVLVAFAEFDAVLYPDAEDDKGVLVIIAVELGADELGDCEFCDIDEEGAELVVIEPLDCSLWVFDCWPCV